MLLPCFHRDCQHPVCQGGDKATCFWYSSGPAVSFLPQPAVDQERPWGSTSCEKCLQAGQTMCCGHYLPVEKMIQLHTNGSVIRYSKPPREIVQAAVMDNDSLSHQQLEELARECLKCSQIMCTQLINAEKLLHQKSMKKQLQRKTERVNIENHIKIENFGRSNFFEFST